MTRHCHKCGWEWTLAGQPGRSESCHQCGADLRVCLNCVSYDVRAAHQCRDRRAEPEAEKAAGNFCEYFEFARRNWVAGKTGNSREDAARQQLKNCSAIDEYKKTAREHIREPRNLKFQAA